MNDKYFINDLVVITSALCGLCLSSGLVFKTNISAIYFFELNTFNIICIYLGGIITGIILTYRILNNKKFKIPEILCINVAINRYLYANGFFFYLFLLNVLINMLPVALIPDICYYYGSYYKVKDFYFIIYLLWFIAGITQGIAISFIIFEKFKNLANKIMIIPFFIIGILSFLLGVFLTK